MLPSTMELQLVPPQAFVLLRHREGGKGGGRERCSRSLSVSSVPGPWPNEVVADVGAKLKLPVGEEPIQRFPCRRAVGRPADCSWQQAGPACGSWAMVLSALPRPSGRIVA